MLCVNLMCSLNAMHTLSILRQNVNGSLSVVVQSMSVKVKQELLIQKISELHHSFNEKA